MKALLIDADYVAFATASAVQTTILWDDDIATTHADLKQAQDVFVSTVRTYAEQIGLDPDEARNILCFSCPSRRYFRHDIADDYKGNRKGARPLILRQLLDWAYAEFGDDVFVRERLEADDVIGILATRNFKDDFCVVSVDKDLDQIEGEHFNPMRNESYAVEPTQALRTVYFQTLCGDSTDNYPGCPGIGEVKAGRILAGLKTAAEMEAATIKAFIKAGLTVEDFAKQLNLARIITADTYDFKGKAPKLWVPSASYLSETA